MEYNPLMKTALTIAGSDPTGGAGLQADLRVFHALGVHGLSIPAALTAQSTSEVQDIWPVERGFFERQLTTLLSDIRPDALKTGMLYSVHVVEHAAQAMRKHELKNLVIDPVSVSSTGASLVEEGMLDALKAELFPLARLITPNVYEASIFTGMKVESPEEMEAASVELMKLGPGAVVVTGGHLENLTLDVYYDGGSFQRLETRKIGGDYHGTGCVFSAAITAYLAHGHTPLEAVRRAKNVIQEAVRGAFHPGLGMGILRV